NVRSSTERALRIKGTQQLRSNCHRGCAKSKAIISIEKRLVVALVSRKNDPIECTAQKKMERRSEHNKENQEVNYHESVRRVDAHHLYGI
ncbi:MAG: hypothetical protein VX416_09060, partial [Pseudomonadota bacterium]|nr:hypothetical protein [Pseudomonadota bacterium]